MQAAAAVAGVNTDELAGLKGEAALEMEAAFGKEAALDATAAARLPRSHAAASVCHPATPEPAHLRENTW